MLDTGNVILMDIGNESNTFGISFLINRKYKQAVMTLIINQQMHYIKFHIKTLKIAPTCFDPKIILGELHCSLLKSF